jgi:hypothetical protein
VVTAVELRLFPVAEMYAGLLWWPIAAAPDVLQAWRKLTQSGLPEEFTTTARLMRFPAIAEIPEPVRGGSFVVIDVIHLGTQAEADRILTPLRALRPVMDTLHVRPARQLGHLHVDPEHPVPVAGAGLLLDTLSPAAIDGIIKLAGPEADTPLLAVELRHLSGEMRRARPANGALAAIDAGYALFCVGLVTGPESAAAVTGSVSGVQAAMTPWAARQNYLNFSETSQNDPASFWGPQAYDRLRRIKAAVDPQDRIRSNHPIPPAVPD